MSNIIEKNDYFESYDKLKIFYRAWLPKENKKNTVLIGIHGAAVHSQNMSNVGEYFSKQGYPFYAYDRRSFGNCEPKNKGHIESYRVYMKDTIAFIEYVKSIEKPEKSILIGHSNGGALAFIVAAENPDLVDKAILSSPNFKLKNRNLFSHFRVPLAKVLGTVLPKMRTSTYLKPEILAKDPKALERENDPLYVKKVTSRWVREMFNASKEAKKVIEQLTMPTLFLVAGDDREIDSKYTIKFFDKIKDKKGMKIKIFDDNFHENFNDTPENSLIVFQEIENFIE